MAAFLDRAGSSRTRCAFCASAITKDEIRVVQEAPVSTTGERRTRTYGHLHCTIDLQRSLAHEALISPTTSLTLISSVIAEVSRLDARLADEVRTLREQRIPITRAVKPLDDPRALELLAELERAPGDRGLLAVLGDHLQHLGDERGELIILDLAASIAPEALVRRRELSARLSPKFPSAKLSWGIGFLRKIEMYFDATFNTLSDRFAHPSCRLLEVFELQSGHRMDIVVDGPMLPRSLRTLITGGRLRADLLPLRHLTNLVVMDAVSLEHPTVRSLELASPTRDTVRALDPALLPAVTTRSSCSISKRPAGSRKSRSCRST